MTRQEACLGATIENGHEAVIIKGVHIRVVQAHGNLMNTGTTDRAVAVEEAGQACRVVHQSGGGAIISCVVGRRIFNWVSDVGGSTAAGLGGWQLAAGG